MIIELFGLPGCGKTTYAKESLNNKINILNTYIYSNSRIKRNINKLYLCVKMVVTNFNKFINLLKILSKINFKSLKLKLKMYQYVISYVSLIIIIQNKKYDNDVFFDEGILNVIWALAYNSQMSELQILELLKDFKEYIGDKIIFINTDKKIILNRLLNRDNIGGSELEHDIKNNKDSINNAKNIMDFIYKQISVEKSVDTIKMNGGE